LFEREETFYDVLGVEPTATSKEIKEKYLELSKKYHPDMNPENAEAAAKFHSIAQAYDTLSQGKLRRMYDKGNLGRMTSVADRESATHSFDGSGFVEGRAKFQEKMTGKTRSVSGRKTNDELDAWVKNHTTHSFRRAKGDNISRASGTSRVETGRRFTRSIQSNSDHYSSARGTQSQSSGSGLSLVILVIFVSIVLKSILS